MTLAAPSGRHRRTLAQVLAGCTLLTATIAAHAQTSPQPTTNWWDRYEARVTATQDQQPHWVTPLITVTPRLEQEVRTDFVNQRNNDRSDQWNYDNGKGLEIIPEKHTELLFNLPPFTDHRNGGNDGFGDVSFLLKERLFSRNEEHGDGIITAFLGASVPTGKNGNGSCCAIVTPTLAMGKGFGRFDYETTAGGSLPVTNAHGLGHTILWNNTFQYHVATTGFGRYFWPELEFNNSFFKGGSNDGQIQAFATPGLLIGRIPLAHHPSGTPGRLGLTFGAGEQIALTHFHTYTHATVITARIPF